MMLYLCKVNYFLYLCTQIYEMTMNHDLPQSVPQGSYGAQDPENRRILQVANELRRLCQVYETQCRVGKKNVDRFETELRCTEQYAKEHGCWIPMEHIFELGVPGPSGNENDTYVTDDAVFKVNNLMNSASVVALLEKVQMHNLLFPDTAYKLHGFAGFEGRIVHPVLRQKRVANAQPATQVMIDTYMAALGFTKTEFEGHFANGTYEAWDLLPRNVLVDKDGDLYVVDAEIKQL